VLVSNTNLWPQRIGRSGSRLTVLRVWSRDKAHHTIQLSIQSRHYFSKWLPALGIMLSNLATPLYCLFPSFQILVWILPYSTFPSALSYEILSQQFFHFTTSSKTNLIVKPTKLFFRSLLIAFLIQRHESTSEVLLFRNDSPN
jgi:hypothetical protein